MTNKREFKHRTKNETVVQFSKVDALVSELRAMIDEARRFVAIAVNAGLTILYWRVGKRIREDILHNDRAGYGKQILQTLSAKSS